MAYNVGERVSLTIRFGKYAGVEAEVDAIVAFPVYAIALTRAAALEAAEGPAPTITALRELYEWVEANARPTWNLVDGRGPVPPTAVGMLRLPTQLMVKVVSLWVETYDDEPDPVDGMREDIERRAAATAAAVEEPDA